MLIIYLHRVFYKVSEMEWIIHFKIVVLGEGAIYMGSGNHLSSVYFYLIMVLWQLPVL